MTEGTISLQPSPYSQNNGVKISPSNIMRSNNHHDHGRSRDHNEHLQGSEFGNSNSTSNISHAEASSASDGMKGEQSSNEIRQNNHSLNQTNKNQNHPRSSSEAINLNMNLSKPQASSQSLSVNNEELPPRILLFSPSPDKESSPRDDHGNGNNHGHSRHYDRDTSNCSSSSNANVSTNINDGTNTSQQIPPQAPAKSSNAGGVGGVSSSPSHSNKLESTNSRSNIAPSNSAHIHNHDRVTNETSSTSSLYGHHDRDSYGGGRHTNTYNSHTGGERRYGNRHGYEDSYQLHNHHDHPNQRHSSNDEYYDPHQSTSMSRNTGSGGSIPGPLDPGLPPVPGVGNSTGGGGAYSRHGMQASRLAYEHDLHNSNSNISHHHSHHHPPPTPSSEYHSYGSDKRKEEMKHYHPPQASPSVYDRYGHRPNTRFEMEHRRLPLLDIGGNNGDQRISGGTTGGACAASNSGGALIGAGVGHSMDENDKNHGFDGRTGGYHVSPAVAISRRGGTKRSPYDQPEHIFSNDHNGHPSPPNIRNTSAVRYCTPIVTGSERNRLDNSKLTQGGQGQDDHLHNHIGGGGFGRANNGGPSPPSSRYDDHHDSHLRHYHRPYPCIRGSSSSPPRYNDGSPQHHHHNQRGSPSHYATPVLLRNNSIRDRPYYDPPHPHMQSSYHHREKENYSYPPSGYPHHSSGFYSPYGSAMVGGPGGGRRHLGHGHPEYHHPNSLHHGQLANNNNNKTAKNTDSAAPPQQKKQRRNNLDTDKPKTKSAAASKPPRRKKMYSDYVGVTYNKTHAKFQACITHYRKQHYLGRYKLAVDAARAYDKSAKELKGDGWKINFQGDEDYEKAKLKEISDTEKKKAAAAAKLLQEQEDSKLPSTGDQEAGAIANPSYTGNKPLATMKSVGLPLVAQNSDAIEMEDITSSSAITDNTEHKSSTSHTTVSSSDKVKSTTTCISKANTNAMSSAVTPSPHAQNLNKMNQASLMNEPLISPLPKVSSMNTPLVQKSVFSPTPVKQSALHSGDTQKRTSGIRGVEADPKNTVTSSNRSSDMSSITDNIFSSPLEKQDKLLTATVTDTKKLNYAQTTSRKTDDSITGIKNENEVCSGAIATDMSTEQVERKMPKVEEAENAAQALLMIRH